MTTRVRSKLVTNVEYVTENHVVRLTQIVQVWAKLAKIKSALQKQDNLPNMCKF